MQAFGNFFCRIEYNSIYFARIDSGYSCIRRYVCVQNRKPSGSAKKFSPVPIYPAKCERTFEGVPIFDGGGGRRYNNFCKYANK